MNRIENRRFIKRQLMYEKSSHANTDLGWGHCTLCGNIEKEYNMEFHHLFPGKAISDILREKKWDWSDREHQDQLLAEINKTILVCTHCHKSLHYDSERLYK